MTSGGEGDERAAAFTYDPHPNVDEQRELRREYRALLATAQNTRRHLPEAGMHDLEEMVRVGDELYTKDGLLDSRFLLNLSDMGAEMTRQMRREADAFDVDELMHRVARCIGGSVNRAPQRAGRVEAEADHAVSGDVELWHWDQLGALAARHSHRAPVSEHMLGPLQVTVRHRRMMRERGGMADEEENAPEQLGQGDMEPSENETSRMVLDIARRLEACSGDDGVNLFAFALNPESFSDSVENLFYISFLIRDGKAAITDDDEGSPMLLPCEEPTEEDRQAGLTRRQLILELDPPLWRELVALYHITTPMIPTRGAPAAPVATTGWYS